ILNLTKNFTWYEIRQLSRLGKYSIRLYELLCQYRSTGRLIIKLDELRHRLGLLPDDYTDMSNFKRKVLVFAIDEILKFTDIEKLEYEQQKQGRTIVGFDFSFKFKQKEKPKPLDQKDPNTIDIFDNLTDKEREIIAQKNAYADQIRATEQHRQNLIKKALEQHRQAEQSEQERKQREKAERQTKKQQEKEQLELGQRQFEQILASDGLINAYIANNIVAKYLSGLQKMRFEQGDFRGVFEMERYKFEQLHELQRLNLKFLD
ncbi:RepB family plasmid replication initiator protein, partial [Moraxella catarrhalis]|nr:RepB family plasmid replication initiator protein [Moraxella catarrhalis]